MLNESSQYLSLARWCSKLMLTSVADTKYETGVPDLYTKCWTKYKLNPFAVKQKYGENVPHNLTEMEFWTRFFQSHYFHRDRINTGTQDIFSECAKQDEKGRRISSSVSTCII